MSTAELVNAIIESATALVREELITADAARRRRADAAMRMRAAAEQAKDLYEQGGELAEWTALDAEEAPANPVPSAGRAMSKEEARDYVFKMYGDAMALLAKYDTPPDR